MTITTLITIGGTIISWIAGKKYLFPYIKQAYDWIRNYKRERDRENIDSSKELLEIKEQANDIYENQLNFCMKQISDLQDTITGKQKELNDYIDQLSQLRGKIVELQKELYQYQMKNSQLCAMYCSNSECKFRQYYKDDSIKK